MLRTLLDPNLVVRQPPEAPRKLSVVGNIIPLTRALHQRNLSAISSGHKRNIQVLSDQHSKNLAAIASLHSRNLATIAHLHCRNMTSLSGTMTTFLPLLKYRSGWEGGESGSIVHDLI